MADPAYTQSNRHIAFSVDERAEEEVLLLRNFTWHEELGRMPVGTLDLVSTDHDIRYGDYIGKKVTIRLDMENDGCRYFHGYLTSIQQLTPEGRLAHFRATVHPWYWLHGKTTDCRIFQGPPDEGITVPAIIEQIFNERGLGAFENKLNETSHYRKWEYCVQYRESELDFLSRLMEQEGISYFFVHGETDHAMYLVDASSCYQDAGYQPFRYRATRPSRYEGPYVYEWNIHSEFRSGAVAQRDFNFKDSSVLVDSAIGEQQNWDGDPFELYDYPGEFVDKNEGDRLASVRWDELQAMRDVRQAATDSRGLYAGGKITLKDHPRREECDKEYLVVSLTHHAYAGDYGASADDDSADESYECTFEAIPADRQFRPARVTPKPLVHGPQTAIVVTTSESEEILCDEYGRVKVQFHWDRYGNADDQSSCWVRVSQNWAGAKWGSLFLPRRGQEVIVEFEEGDPDRPIITGRVYNVENPVPYTLPEFKTISTIKSLSSTGG
ncbi:MAG: type VI secretion system tip protein VgrG, partial [Verrucomicrobiae bacterium]|nr:type VI secretion system tip protein VgrG [Verrucomicrobiae bacterium]